jgi:ABC-type metal ion transport system substrate-binding protein
MASSPQKNLQFISPPKEAGDFLQNQVKVVEFSDYITPDKALADGDIDLVSYQHKPFLDNFNKQNGTDLVPIGNTILMRMGIYSDKYKSVDALPDGAVIAIPNDPTNGGRGLALLQRAGLLKLKDGVGFKATPADVDAAVITMNYVMSAGLNVKEQGTSWNRKTNRWPSWSWLSGLRTRTTRRTRRLLKSSIPMLSRSSLPINTTAPSNRLNRRA